MIFGLIWLTHCRPERYRCVFSRRGADETGSSNSTVLASNWIISLCRNAGLTPTAVGSTATGATTTARLVAITAIAAHLPGNRSAQRKRCSRNCQQRILTERSRQVLKTRAKSPSERKEPPTPKKPPIKEPNKRKKPIGDPPKRAPKRVALQGYFQDSIWQDI